jgi:hypothetical protein
MADAMALEETAIGSPSALCSLAKSMRLFCTTSWNVHMLRLLLVPAMVPTTSSVATPGQAIWSDTPT